RDSPLWDVSTTPPTSLQPVILAYGGKDASTGETKLRPGARPVFSPDGRWFAIAGQESATLRIVDTATQTTQSILAFVDRGHPCSDPYFSPDGETAAVEIVYDQRFYRWQGILNYRSWRPV